MYINELSQDNEKLENLIKKYPKITNEIKNRNPDKIILPLYSYSKKGIKTIYSKSGLNQWNANGRSRNFDEVYIPFNRNERQLFKDFFPDRNTYFKVQLPNGKELIMKVCQENGKSIMSKPNKDLGNWILREILFIPEGKTVKYDDLYEKGIDSVSFEKINNSLYKIKSEKLGSYEIFLENFI